MSKKEIEQIISECCNDLVFIYNGKKSGITSEVKSSVPTFQAWHGSKVKEYSNIDNVMNDKFYSGKSITDLAGKITFSFA